MKVIKTFQDITFIINNKCDVYEPRGYVIPYVRFLSLSLLEIINILNEQNHKYETPDM